ncbi:MBL fold metallo-hydrolase [Halomontanus rarus]|uniref:MBL fold metallo-hydrolase n=1 Tax=Halomontanus rarus TaxID=3034020 RepID=UPI001A981E47
MKRAVLVVLVALAIVLAGCAGGFDGNGAETEAPSDDDIESDSGDSDESDGTDDTGEPIAEPQAVGDALAVVDLTVDGVTPDEESIVLENTADEPVDLSGFALRDRDGGQVDGGLSPFRFPSGFVLEPGESVTVTTGQGDATDSELYWGYNVNVWRDDGDVVRLVGPDGQPVLEHAYGDIDLGDADRSGESDESNPDGDDGERDVAGELEIHHIDVGQADSTLLVTPDGETILIDTGDWPQDGSDVIAYLEAQGIDRIDHLVATHSHADHIGGHAAVIEHFETNGDGIGAAYDSGIPASSATYDNYLDAVEEYDVDLLLVERGDELPIEGDVSARVLNPPPGASGDQIRNNDVALAVEFGAFQYVTTGDAESGGESRMLEEWGSDLEADVYQVGHHGSSTSSSEAFVDAVDPEAAIISSAYDSQYGHPSDDVLERFADREIDTYWTPVHGDIVVRTDGASFEVETGESFSTNAADILDEKPDSGDETDAISPAPLRPGVGGSGFDGAVSPALG